MTAPLTPTWLSPSVPGQMTNKRGSNTGADNIAMQVRYGNPRQSGDAAGTIRVVAKRRGSLGGAQSPQVAWDSGFIGTPTTTPTPNSIGQGWASFVYGNRLYAAMVNASGVTSQGVPVTVKLYSAPIVGASVGAWREENPIAWSVAAGALVGNLSSMAVAAGYLYACDDAANIAYAPINGDGSIGNWVTSPQKPAQPGQLIGGQASSTWPVPNQGWLAILGAQGNIGLSAGSTNVQNVGLNPDGSLQSWVAGTALPAARSAMSIFYNPQQNYVVVAGGNDGAATIQSTVWHAPVTGLGAIGTWVLTDQALPAARNGAGIAFDYTNSTLWIVGGNNAGPQATVYNHVLTTAGAVAGAWTTLGTNLPVATIQPACAIAVVSTATTYLIAAGGTGGVTVYDWTGSAWINGVAGGLTAGNLGTGAALVTNADGTQDFTFNYNAFGPTAAIAGFTDGDVVQVDVYFTDVQNGDLSPISSTVFKVGQPPTLSSVLPVAAISTGYPTASFLFNPGAGGGSQYSWRITVKNGSQLVFDTGLRYDRSNSISVNSFPLLQTTVAYTFSWTATATDDVFNGATNTTTQTLAVTPTLAAVSSPTGVTATADNPNGAIKLAWSNPSPPATNLNRVYYRRWGTTKWRLLAELSNASAYTAMDQIALAVPYDFAVSQLDLAAGAYKESPLSAPLSDDFENPTGASNIQTLFRSIGTDATGTLNAWTFISGVPTIAANLVTLPTNSITLAAHADLWDCTVPIRFQFATGNKHRFIFHYVDGNNSIFAITDGSALQLFKRVGGTNVLVQSQAVALVNATSYWVTLAAAGTTYSAKVFTDSAGAITATQVGTTATGVIPELVLQSGQIGVGNVDGGTGTHTVGGAFANVCTVTGPAPAGWTCASTDWTKYEPAFCWSKNAPYGGAYSVSIYAATAPVAGATAYWVPTSTLAAGTYAIASQVKASGTVNAYIQIDSSGTSASVATDNAWHQLVATLTDPGAGNPFRCMVGGGIGTAYFDNATVNLSTAANVQIDPSAYGCFLHIAGQGQSLKASFSLKGVPTFTRKIDAGFMEGFGLAPTVRYGPLDYHDISFEAFIKDLPTLQALQAVLAQAQLGSTVYYRDGFGAMFTCGLDPAADVTYKQPLYRYAKLKLRQIPNLSVSNAQGSALGIASQVAGSVPPLDSSENPL